MSVISSPLDSFEPLDVVGVGLGPANLALAAVIREHLDSGGEPALSSLFLERKPEFSWHPGLMLPGAKVQLSFLKDLVTLRNPQSRFSFLCYLKEQGRLHEFVNLRTFLPTRREFGDYYAWVAARLADQSRYHTEVVSVTPVADGPAGSVDRIAVEVRDMATGLEDVLVTRNLVVGTGGVPYLPPGLETDTSRNAFHSEEFLPRLERDYPDRDAPYRFLVVGAGQSGAEIFLYLLRNYPQAQVTATMRRFAYKPLDDSHFINEIFFPKTVDFLHGLSAQKREWILSPHQDINYSAVDAPLIEAIYQTLYESRAAGEERARIRPFLELRGLVDGTAGTAVHFHDMVHEHDEVLEADAVILATGYSRRRRQPFLEGLAGHLLTDEDGELQVGRDYRLLGRPGFAANVFVQGFCEPTHGPTDSLLTAIPARSGEIFGSLCTSARGHDRRLQEAAV